MNNRQNLRELMKQKRTQLAAATRAEFSSAIVKHLRDSLKLKKGDTVGFCTPIQNEPDILPLVLHWQEQGVITAMAKVVAKNAPLFFIPWRQNEALCSDACGILAPLSNKGVIPQILLIPLLAFDSQGFRLGYGGGYFDRTLAEHNFYAVGIGYEMNRVVSIFAQKHDKKLNAIATEAGFFKFPR